MPRVFSSAGILLALTGTLGAASAARAETECRESPRYLVIERRRDDSFSDFIIKEKKAPTSKIPCVFKAGPKDFKIGRRGDFYNFVALSGHLLMLQKENGGAVTDQELILFDLKAREPIEEIGSHREIEEADEKRIVFWRVSDVEPTKENCEEYARYLDGKDHDGMAAIEAKWTFDFASGKAIPGSEMRCVLLGD